MIKTYFTAVAYKIANDGRFLESSLRTMDASDIAPFLAERIDGGFLAWQTENDVVEVDEMAERRRVERIIERKAQQEAAETERIERLNRK